MARLCCLEAPLHTSTCACSDACGNLNMLHYMVRVASAQVSEIRSFAGCGVPVLMGNMNECFLEDLNTSSI
eukprot:1160739-Pelagomonas_calceolata.AAC.13